MRYLITGATGFLGRHLLHKMEQMGICRDDIVILSDQKVNGYLCVPSNQYHFTKEMFLTSGISHIDVLIHLGAYTPKNTKEQGIAERCFENISHTIHLMNELPNVPGKVIYASSVSVYQTPDQCEPITEKSPIQTADFYGLSKYCCEQFVAEYCMRTGCRLQVLRLGSIYGEGEEVYTKLISSFVQQAVEVGTIRLFSNSARRNLIYAEDCCACILQALDLKSDMGPVNIVSSQSIAIGKIAEVVSEITEYELSKKCNVVIQDKAVRDDLYDNAYMKEVFHVNEIPIVEGIRRYFFYYCELHGVKR